jgi:hypothetical protein
MKIKTNELTGAALDWAVAKCEGIINGDVLDVGFILEGGYSPSTNWAQGGPIIEREGVSLEYSAQPEKWCACIMADQEVYGPTALIAAMRCYVASKLGDEVDVPEELCQPTA